MIGIANAIGFERGFSWSSYWETQPEVLFFAETKNIADGKLYNQKTGSSDYLTVTGAAGSYTFQCPNTAPYIAADTENYLWFNGLGVERTVTEAELIGYDISRTPVKYDNTTPYAIRWIMILKSGETLSASKINSLHLSFDLPIMWSSVLNTDGVIKGNRVAYTPWPPDLGLEAETIALVARMTAQTIAEQTAINDAIVSLKAGGFWTKANIIRLLYANGAANARLNWIADLHNATEAGASITFTARSGYVSGNATSGLNENFIPSADGGALFTQNDASDIYYHTSTQNAAGFFGVRDAGSTKMISCGNLSPGTGLHRINQANAGAGTLPVMIDGMIGNIRTGANVNYTLMNAAKTDQNAASTGLPDKNMHSLAYNAADIVLQGGGTTASLKFRFIGASLSQAEFNALKTIVDTFIADY